MKFERAFNLEKSIEKNKVVVIYGPRQVGKTTLLEDYLSQTRLKYKLDSGDRLETQQILSSQNFEAIFEYAQGYELIAIDEAQHIPNIGMGLKIMVDHIKGIRIIATGSSSFQLSGQIGEPLVGRKKTVVLYPLSQIELSKINNKYELKKNLEEYLIYGSYPAVLTKKTKPEKIKTLDEIINSHLLQDILILERVKGSKVLLDLLRLVAFQIGGEVSLSELGSQVGLDTKTVARYLDLFEKSFILFNLRGYSKNLRREIVKMGKYYFYDNGIRNSLISSFNKLEKRNDIGQLWENFMVAERLKKQAYRPIYANNFFWRTWDKQEIDWLEERSGKLFGFEFKYNKSAFTPPKLLLETYPEASAKLVNKDNYLDFVT